MLTTQWCFLKLSSARLCHFDPFGILRASSARNLVMLEFKRFLVADTPRNDRTEFLK